MDRPNSQIEQKANLPLSLTFASTRICPCDPRATDRRAFFTMQPILRPVELCIHGADIISIAGTDAWRERSVTDA